VIFGCDGGKAEKSSSYKYLKNLIIYA